MKIDKTTLYDLGVFQRDEEYSLFHKLDFTTTGEGKNKLLETFNAPLKSIQEIEEIQQILTLYTQKIESWPKRITNGTMLVVEKYLDDNPADIPTTPDFIKSFVYKLLHPADHSMIVFSMRQVFEFIKGYDELHAFFNQSTLPAKLATILALSQKIIESRNLSFLKSKKSFLDFNRNEVLQLAHVVFHIMPSEFRKLIEYYGYYDAWYSMAQANIHFKLQNPTFIAQNEPFIEVNKLSHILLENPVPYSLEMNSNKNFIFLTGANMAGKSTLIKSLGLSVYMAHMGLGVAAEKMSLTVFEGILSNVNVEDNIAKGESFFFNEVKRIKNTLIQISDGRKWLVLIDELFKGTNIQDAMKCSLAVVKGLCKMKNGLFILSSHLYEIGEELKSIPSISFLYFETLLKEKELFFSYQLREGISQDRMGYMILEKEGVTALLEKIAKKSD